MKCQYFGCQREAAPGWPCCGEVCGARNRDAIRLAKAYLEKDLLPYGETLIGEWPKEKLEYYIAKVQKFYTR